MSSVLRILMVFVLIQGGSAKIVSYCDARNLLDVAREGLTLNPTGGPFALTTFVGTVDPSGKFIDTSQAGVALAPVLSAAISQAVTQQSPLASVAPAFTYRYNPALNVHERSSTVPGPLFSERALTLGQGQLNFGIGYSYIDLDRLNGSDLHGLRSPLLLEISCPGKPLTDPFCNPDINGLGRVFIGAIGLSSVRTRLDVQSHLVVPTVRYGLTDNWDIGISIPIVNTFLRVRNELVRVAQTTDAVFLLVPPNNFGLRSGLVDANLNPVESATSDKVRYFAVNLPRQTLTKVAGSATGVGDIILRTKYHLWQVDEGGAALGLQLRLPSGDKKNFQGNGATHVTPFLYLSQIYWDLFEPHLNLGMDFDTEDVKRSAFLYSVGATVAVGQKLGLALDVIGRSELGRFQLGAGTALQGLFVGSKMVKCADGTDVCRLVSAVSTFRFPTKIKRNDITDISFGLRYALGTSGSVFFGAILPLNDDGFRADFIPSGGVEYTF